MNKKKYEKITLVLTSYNKIKFKKKNNLSDFKNLFLVLYIFKSIQNNIQINFFNGKKHSKIHTLVKGPKCHKVGKHLIKYCYYTYYITIIKETNLNKNLVNLNKYFQYTLNYLNIYDTNYSNTNKYILNTYVSIM